MRLTKDLKTPHDDTTYVDDLINVVDRENIVLTKLKHYEDIEEQLGIDLITLFKAYHIGFYIKYEDGFRGFIRGGEYYLEVGLETKCFMVKEFNPSGTRWYFKDYGKTWALTKEELL